MALKDIMAISGYPGLYKYVSQGRNGIIVESLTDGKRSHIAASAKVSALSDIAIFTNDGEKPLREILNSIKGKENGGSTISHKSSNDELKKFFLEVEPNYDTDRVYTSDIKKVVSWYNQLQDLGMLDFEEEEEVAEQNAENAEATEAGQEVKTPKAKAQPKSAAAKEKKPTAQKKAPAAKAKPAGDGAKKSTHQKKG
ncbi:DUF5606 family protein [Perlabentimonas gracilis]|uniref:DUF5606 family protein n=1 Tax=Perlabentimonas gracilis TaxID=2715279 RepID=UPI001409E12F|nr:DUF5606 domain-containing protein [Perlabentimonas gracilis]NHB68249.1 DUF5606 domain-containing protein [Perlabentimonas gracilis]